MGRREYSPIARRSAARLCASRSERTAPQCAPAAYCGALAASLASPAGAALLASGDGVGLAAPQIGQSIRLFVIDTLQIEQDEKDEPPFQGFKKVFINARKVEETGKPWSYEEGCLSIPRIRGDVERPETIRLRYQDENFVEYEETFTGINARVVQHEYDHIDGVLFTEKLKPLKKRLIQRKLEDIRLGKINVEYKMRFFNGR